MNWRGKLKGAGQSPPRVGLEEIVWSWLGAFLGMGAVGLIHAWMLSGLGLSLLIGSFGASAVLIYGAPKSPLAQPRNLMGGHLLSALVGVAVCRLLPEQAPLAGALAVATAIAVMHLTRTLHPPGGATALIAVIGGDAVRGLGFVYALVPVGLGAAVMLLVALIFNNLPKGRRYPEFWY